MDDKTDYPTKCAFCNEKILTEDDYIVHVYIEHPKENKGICEMLRKEEK